MPTVFPGGGGVTDHGALTGLADDDHSQYLTTTRHAAITGNPHGTTAAQVTGAARTDAVNTFTTGPQVFVGGATIRQTGGTAGTDEVQVTHDGTRGSIRSMDGPLRLLDSAGFGLDVTNNSGVLTKLSPSSGTRLELDAGTVELNHWISDDGTGEFRTYAGFRLGWTGHSVALVPSAAGVLMIDDRAGSRRDLQLRNINATGDIESHGTSSTATLRLQAYQRGGFYDSTDATRKGKLERYATDATADRMTDTAATDGSRGYFIPMVHTTAPPDAMLPNNSGCIFMDAGVPKLRYKDNSGTVSTISLGGGMAGP